jgi:hypothetical protein
MPQTVNIDGVGVVHFPDDFTHDQITHAIETEILPQATPKPTASAAADVKPEAPNALERFGRGMTDIGDRAAQLWMNAGSAMNLPGYRAGPGGQSLADVGTQQMNAENAQYEAGRAAGAPDGKPGIDMMRMAGNAVATAPLALAGGPATSLLGRAGVGALQGALGGAAQYDPTNSLLGSAQNVGLGALGGGVAGPALGAAGDGISSGLQALLGRIRGAAATLGGKATDSAIINAVPELAQLAPEARYNLIAEAQAQVRKTGDFSTEQLGRKANLLEQGVTPTKSMVTRDPADWTQERNLQKLSQSPDETLAGFGKQMTDVYQGNDRALAGKLQSFSQGLPAGTQEGHGQTVMQALDGLSRASQKDVSAVYDTVRQARGDELASDARNLHSTLDDLSDSPAADPVTEAAKRRLKKLGMLDAQGNLTDKTLTVTQAEGLRQFINQQPNVYGKSQIIKAIDSDVLSGLGDDAFKGARAGAKARFDMLDNPATQRALNAYGELQQGKTAQNFVKSQVIDAADQDVRSLVGTIGSLPKDKAAQTMDSLRAGLMQHLQDKAINPNSGQFSGAKLSTAMRDLGDTKLVTVLGGQTTQKLKKLARAGLDATYQPAYAAVNHSNTAPMLMSLIQKGRAIPGVPLIVNENAEKLAARSGYQSQLADILAARSGQAKGGSAERLQTLAKILSGAGPGVSNAALNQARNSQ